MIDAGGGDDLVYNYGDDVTIRGGAGFNRMGTYGGEDVTIEGGDDGNLVRVSWNAGAAGGPKNSRYVTVTGGAEYDDMISYGERVDMYGLGGNDYLLTYGNFSVLDGGDGGDVVVCAVGQIGADGVAYYSTGNTLIGGAGDDRIQNYGIGTTIYGGDDNDFIINFGTNARIDGGNGHDTIYDAGQGMTQIDVGVGGSVDWLFIDKGLGTNTNVTAYGSAVITFGSAVTGIAASTEQTRDLFIRLASGANIHLINVLGSDGWLKADISLRVADGPIDPYNPHTTQSTPVPLPSPSRSQVSDLSGVGNDVMESVSGNPENNSPSLSLEDYDNIWFKREDDASGLSGNGSDDKIIVPDWANATAVDHLADASDIDLLIQAMAGFNPPPFGRITDDPMLAAGMPDNIANVWNART